MKKVIFIFILIVVSFFVFQPGSLYALTFQHVLSGKVTEALSGNTIPGVTIYFPDLKTGSVTDLNGNYSIGNLPETKLKVQVKCIGYKMIVEQIDLSVVSTKDFVMEESVSELNEIVVTGLSQAAEKNRTPTPITTVPSIELQQSNSTNIIDALTSKPGINQLSTGVAISKPVIRGLGYNRVVVVNDGIRQEGQQWGDEHGVEIDEFAVDHVEILKGPASLMYGSDAMAGVINFLSAPTLSEGNIEGNVIANYQSNNGQVGYSFNVAGNKKNFIWDLRWSQKLAHAYQNKYDGFVLNSGFREHTLNGIVGVNKHWGYSHLHFSMYNLEPGMVEGERDSITGSFTKPVALNDSTEVEVIANDYDFKSYEALVPYQQVKHMKAVLNNSFILGAGNLKATLGWQQNRRQEYGDVLSPDNYGLYFLLNTINYDIKYIFPESKGYYFTAGVNGMFQDSQNKGVEFLVPEYNLFDAGVFGVVRKSMNKLDISCGLRYDIRLENGFELILDSEGKQTSTMQPGYTQKFTSFETDFGGLSGSIGATYQFSELLFTKLNVANGFRAPNIAELGSNGEHEGSGRYEIGNPDLKSEQSLQIDFTFGINSDHVSAEANLFANEISNFIFLSRLSGAQGSDSTINDLPVYAFVSGKAQMAGGEISIDIHPHPLDWLHFENTFSVVEGWQPDFPDSAKHLPNIPAPKFTTVLKATTKKLTPNLLNAFASVGLDYYFEQNKYYALNNTETSTGSYSLVNAGIGADLNIKNRTWLTLYFSVNNLFDEAYQNHLSRLKYTPENYATGRKGVYEMGRNFNIKLIVPFKVN